MSSQKWLTRHSKYKNTSAGVGDKNIPLNIHLLPKITTPYTASVVIIPFIRPIQIWTITYTSFLNRHNSRDSLKVLANYLSLSKNMKTLFFCAAHSSRPNVQDTKQPLNKHMIQLGYFIDP